ILSLDLASALGSAAVWADGAIVGAATRAVNPSAGASHASLWRALLAESLASAGLHRSALSLLAVTVGPGSFTGIRVGVAAMRGLGVGLGLRVWGETAFAVAAEAVDAAGRPLLVAIDSGRGALFVQRFDAAGAPTGLAVDGPFEQSAAPWAGEVGWVATGDAAARAQLAAGGFHCLDPQVDSAAALARRVARLRAAGAPLGAPLPLYIRPPDATPPAQGGRIRA
ncbi:MAG: tRNA (adenosine(37)-N6)-threonylcarbamoyltransferase complex dimerization subunit type 1 TsaB, partial [Elsteraceae bacterium]